MKLSEMREREKALVERIADARERSAQSRAAVGAAISTGADVPTGYTHEAATLQSEIEALEAGLAQLRDSIWHHDQAIKQKCAKIHSARRWPAEQKRENLRGELGRLTRTIVTGEGGAPRVESQDEYWNRRKAITDGIRECDVIIAECDHEIRELQING